MDKAKNYAGVVLAGGRSSRMGSNKAFLKNQGRFLIDHMMDILLKTGCTPVFILGSVPGYNCVADDKIFAGPAQAISSFMHKKLAYPGFLVVPIDMPLLTPSILYRLTTYPEGAYYKDCPLPAYIPQEPISAHLLSMHDLLDELGASAVTRDAGNELLMKNINTPNEWKEFTTSHEC